MNDSMEHWLNDIDGGKPTYSEKTYPVATLGKKVRMS